MYVCPVVQKGNPIKVIEWFIKLVQELTLILAWVNASFSSLRENAEAADCLYFSESSVEALWPFPCDCLQTYWAIHHCWPITWCIQAPVSPYLRLPNRPHSIKHQSTTKCHKRPYVTERTMVQSPSHLSDNTPIKDNLLFSQLTITTIALINRLCISGLNYVSSSTKSALC